MKLILATVVAVTLSAPFASIANAHDAGVSGVNAVQASPRVHMHLPTHQFCHRQLANDNGRGILSQNFIEPEYENYDSRGADDFTLRQSCTVAQVRVNGLYYAGSGPADAVNVNFFKSQSSGAVGRNIFQFHDQEFRDPSGTGNFNIILSHPAKFAPGKYWVSVAVDMSVDSGGEWGWLTNNYAKGSYSKWQNTGDGFGTGCIKWTDTLSCWPNGGGPDFVFALEK